MPSALPSLPCVKFENTSFNRYVLREPGMQHDGIARDGIRKGELVVVTGGGGGFGRAFCRRFARDGAKVAVWDVDTALGEETVRQGAGEGGEARLFKGDHPQ